VPRRQGNWLAGTGATGSFMSSLGGKYVLVLPYDPVVLHYIAARAS
jgi:hypothetical protein